MTGNHLPDGVGKKIVEALKRQAEANITPVPASNKINKSEVTAPQNLVKEIDLTEYDNALPDIGDDNLIIEEEPQVSEPCESVSAAQTQTSPVLTSEFELKDESDETPVPPQTVCGTDNNDWNLSNISQAYSTEQVAAQQNNSVSPAYEPAAQPLQAEATVTPSVPVTPLENVYLGTASSAPQNKVKQKIVTPSGAQPAKNVLQQKTPVDKGVKIKIPYNVSLLNNLIATLPAGVNKQVGAQIIRQTLEAMGISMNGVLKEAQELQEQLNGSTRDCMIKIQEHKTLIMQLEQQVQEYQRHVSRVNDLISLFLLTDRK